MTRSESAAAFPPRVRVLVVEDDQDVQDLLASALDAVGLTTVRASTGEEALRIAESVPLHLVVLDMMLPECDGITVARALRADAQTADVPIIMVTARDQVEDKLMGFGAGVDDYVVKPFDTDELLARVRTQLRHVERNMLSEMTGLPGNRMIERAIQQTIDHAGVKWAILYVDIDHFKPYNDGYGFVKGNQVIQTLATVLTEAAAKYRLVEHPSFVGHIGGDDFIAIVDADMAEELCRDLIKRFDQAVPDFYDARDARRGYVVGTDRRGQETRFPLVSLSIGVVTNRHRRVHSHWQVGEVAAQVKKKAKAMPGSSFYVDRRR